MEVKKVAEVSPQLRKHAFGQSDQEAALAIAFARHQRPPMKRFVYQLRLRLGWTSLSRQMIYKWENHGARVPASVLLAAASVCGLSVDELLLASRRALISEQALEASTRASTPHLPPTA
jgi:hypothetical protein